VDNNYFGFSVEIINGYCGFVRLLRAMFIEDAFFDNYYILDHHSSIKATLESEMKDFDFGGANGDFIFPNRLSNSPLHYTPSPSLISPSIYI
jgi:hypothetical protein